MCVCCVAHVQVCALRLTEGVWSLSVGVVDICGLPLVCGARIGVVLLTVV